MLPARVRLASGTHHREWLQIEIIKSVDGALAELHTYRKTGAHRVLGWEGESDQALDDSEIMLDTDVRQISAGVIVVAAVAAVESLMNRMLDHPGDESLHKAGLTRKARELAVRWQSAFDRAELEEHVTWLGKRRNSFAHRLIDDVDLQWRTQPPGWDFDEEMADEALVRVSAIAWMLEEGWEQRLTQHDSA